MDFSREQELALEAIKAWMESPSSPQIFRLSGYAGTGKTTLVRYIDGIDYYAAFTGKAAHVLRQKGVPATTIHSLIYIPASKSRARLLELEKKLELDPTNVELAAEIAKEKKNVKRPMFSLNYDSPLKNAFAVAIDEGSMLDERIGSDLMSFGCKILVLDDPAQLPPVYGRGFLTNAPPDAQLTEIHRQARGNPILDLATTVRQTKALPAEHQLIRREKITPEMALEADQLIVGRNATRAMINGRMRELLGYTGPFPVPGDKVVCTRNNHDLGLLNGAVHRVVDCSEEDGFLWMELDDIEGEIKVHRELFLGEEISHWGWDNANHFEFGYALTCHKAQGSQWDKVGVFDESGAFRENRARWLYTAITRAAKELWVKV